MLTSTDMRLWSTCISMTTTNTTGTRIRSYAPRAFASPRSMNRLDQYLDAAQRKSPACQT